MWNDVTFWVIRLQRLSVKWFKVVRIISPNIMYVKCWKIQRNTSAKMKQKKFIHFNLLLYVAVGSMLTGWEIKLNKAETNNKLRDLLLACFAVACQVHAFYINITMAHILEFCIRNKKHTHHAIFLHLGCFPHGSLKWIVSSFCLHRHGQNFLMADDRGLNLLHWSRVYFLSKWS